MRKILTVIVLVAIAATVFAFTQKINMEPDQVTYRYFKVNAGHRNQTDFYNSEVTYETTATSAPTVICSAVDNFLCLVGFSLNQVSASPPYVLLDNAGTTRIPYEVAAGVRKRPNNTDPN